MAIRLDAHRDEFHRDQQWHKPVRVATTADITISTALNAGDTLDGVTLAAGDRVLVKDQSTGSQNGIYIAGASPARAYDMLAGIQAMGSFIYVIDGTANGGTLWHNTNASLPTIGSTALTWEEFTSGGGSLDVTDGTTTVSPTTELEFDSASFDVTDQGGDSALVELLPHAHEPPAPGFHHVLVKRTSDFTTTNSNDSAPDYDHAIADTMVTPWWVIGAPDRLVVTAEYDNLPAIFDSACAWSDPNSAAYVEGKVYCFPAASGRDRPIADDGSDEQYLLRVTQQTADDNTNNFQSVQTFPRIMAEGDIVIVAWRTPSSQTAIEYPVGEDDTPVTITLGAWVPSTPGPEGPEGPAVPLSDNTPLVESGAGVPGEGDEAARWDHVHPEDAETGGGAVPSPILLQSDHSTPFTFDEILQNSEGTDFLWASE